MLYKKGDVGLGAIIVIILIIIFLGWLINEGWKECRVDSDCKEAQYCTSQNTCKDIPVIEKTSPNTAINYNYAAWVIGLSLIVAALIMKWDTLFGKKKKKDDKKEDKYVDLSKSHKAEDKGLYEEYIDERY
jgi:hypothetical protein